MLKLMQVPRGKMCDQGMGCREAKTMLCFSAIPPCETKKTTGKIKLITSQSPISLHRFIAAVCWMIKIIQAVKNILNENQIESS